jgi:hypothetical protein
MMISGKRKWMLAVFILMLAGCGSDGSDPESVLGAGGEEDGGGGEVSGLPNFKVVDFSGPTTHNTAEDYIFSVTLQNTGTVSASIPEVWLMESASPDFSTGYIYSRRPYLSPQGQSHMELGPGETGTYTNSGLLANKHLSLRKLGEVYIKLWVNPDLTEAFNDTKRYAEETDYSDNQSAVWTVNVESDLRRSCAVEEEAMEENDSLEAAPDIALDTEYTTSICFDFKDIYSLDLNEGQRYEINVAESNPTLSMVVLAPDSTIVVKQRVADSVFTVPQTGVHKLAFYVTSGWSGGGIGDVVVFKVSAIN